MKSRKSALSLKSFEEIRALLVSKSISFPEAPTPPLPEAEERVDPELEKKLFREDMKDVIPVAMENVVERPAPDPHPPRSSSGEET